MMNTERWILIGVCCLCMLLLIKLVPREKAREAWVLFLFLQVLTWPAGLFIVEMGWIEYPVQLFPHANDYNKTSFEFEFFIFPLVSIIFSLHYPKNRTKKASFLYYLSFVGIFTAIEVLLEKYTNLVKYHGWHWYWSYITMTLALYLNHKYYLWFRKRIVKGDS